MPYINLKPGQRVTVTITAPVLGIDSTFITLDLGLDQIAIPQDHKAITVTIDDKPENWPPRPGDVWHLAPAYDDDIQLPVEAWYAIACRDYTQDGEAFEVQLTQPIVPDCEWQSPEHLLSLGEMRLVYREGVNL